MGPLGWRKEAGETGSAVGAALQGLLDIGLDPLFRFRFEVQKA